MSTLPFVIARPSIFTRLKLYWSLIKDLQTGLLLVTAAAGYLSGCCTNWQSGSLFSLLGSLFLAVGGCTILNMVVDRDIDACMERTRWRPLPSGQIAPAEALGLGLVCAAAGVGWAFSIYPLFGAVVLAGLFLDGVIYTLWLKRRSAFSIFWGGLSGGMPVLAGRVLAVGGVDEVGLLLMAGVLLWIPTHIMTFNIKYSADYRAAGIPTFPAIFGVRLTRWVIAGSTLLAESTLFAAGQLLRLPPGLTAGLAALGGLLLALAAIGLVRPGRAMNFALYKGASIYMLLAMLLIIVGGL